MAPASPASPLLHVFDRVRIINLPHRRDRRRQMTAELRRVGIDPSPQVAFHAAALVDGPGDFSSTGARGCFDSHLSILRQALADDVASLLILEDDLDFARDFPRMMPPVADALAKVEWSIFYGGALGRDVPPAGAPLETLAPDEGVQGTHFVGFRREAIRLAVPYLEAMLARPAGSPAGGPMHVDGAYSWLRRAYPQLTTVLAVPELGHQRPSRTDVHQLSRVERTPVLGQAINALRPVRRWLTRR